MPITIYFCILGIRVSFIIKIGNKRIMKFVVILIPALKKAPANEFEHFPSGILQFQKNAIGVH